MFSRKPFPRAAHFAAALPALSLCALIATPAHAQDISNYISFTTNLNPHPVMEGQPGAGVFFITNLSAVPLTISSVGFNQLVLLPGQEADDAVINTSSSDSQNALGTLDPFETKHFTLDYTTSPPDLIPDNDASTWKGSTTITFVPVGGLPGHGTRSIDNEVTVYDSTPPPPPPPPPPSPEPSSVADCGVVALFAAGLILKARKRKAA
jgi:hypothetical protein